MTLKARLRRLLPASVLDAYRRFRYGRTWFDYEERSIKESFEHIYRNRVWGSGAEEFYSGPGSDPVYSQAYVNAVKHFLQERNIGAIVDLGCGDFRIGRQLVNAGTTYHGVDVVPALIKFNTRHYATEGIQFSCLDITASDLPPAQLCLIREVLQHLSNEEILAALRNCEKYRYVVVTERLAAPDQFRQPNIDLQQRAFTRADHGSGIVLDAPPFNQPVTSVLCDVVLPDRSLIRSVLIEHANVSFPAPGSVAPGASA